MKRLLFEIGTEEIPARFIEPAKAGLFRLLKDGLLALRVSSGEIEIYATPRRMAAFVHDISETQQEAHTVKYGPPWDRAFDGSGNPTKAAIGFAKSQGVSVNELKKGEKDGIEFCTVEKVEKGKETIELLPGLLKAIIPGIPFPKRMRWGDGSFEYARPIHWVIALFGNQPVEFEVAGIMTKNITYGHRFLSTGPIEINNPSEYIEKLRLNGVFVKEDERMVLIKIGIKGIEEEVGGRALADDELIKEIIYITEYPYPLMGGFDKAYLSLPKEVLINVMKGHQRYIPIEDDDNKLLPVFICFANIVPKDDKVVIKGNEKVLKARLADAIFFFEEDKRLPLYDMYDRLSNIVFHERLGTLKEKAERVSKIATYLVRSLDLGDEQRVKRAARLMKTDLLTHMVGEFPELQGTMGRIYALSHGEDAEVACAIEEHYLPSGITSTLPQTITGTILSIADKIDTLTSFFSVGIVPTGNLDPFALRRQAIGLIKIVIDKGLHIKLRDLIMVAYEAGAAIQDRSTFEDIAITLSDFISTRFKFSMIEDNHRQEFIESVLPWVERDIYDGYLRLIALENQSSMDDFKRLLIGFKRAYNITKSITDEKAIEPKLFKEEAEYRLYNLYESLKGRFFSMMQEKRYEDGLSILVSFKEAVDDYFDKVFVMDKDEAIRDNRLALLKRVKDLFMSFGDFSRIHIE